jgi:hypothetical protein
MSKGRDVAATTWGLLSILAGGLMTEGGVMQVIAYWAQGQASNVVVGALGAVGSAALLASGVGFWTRTSFSRKAAIAGALCMIPVHFAGWILGFIGLSGVLLGVAYPTLLLFVLRTRPNLGVPASAEGGSAGAQRPPSDQASRRTSLAVG